MQLQLERHLQYTYQSKELVSTYQMQNVQSSMNWNLFKSQYIKNDKVINWFIELSSDKLKIQYIKGIKIS